MQISNEGDQGTSAPAGHAAAPVLPQWFCAHLIPSSSAQLQMFLHACQNLLYMNSAAKQSVQFLHLHVINKVGKDKEIVFLC